uniref:MIF4G domain-containing protein n=1 Tax=Macrostomum lignano TaxID=282301 RepID=A0A1I8GF99_9PLAT
ATRLKTSDSATRGDPETDSLLSNLSEADLAAQLSRVRADLHLATALLRRCHLQVGNEEKPNFTSRAQLNRTIQSLSARERRCIQLLNRQQGSRQTTQSNKAYRSPPLSNLAAGNADKSDTGSTDTDTEDSDSRSSGSYTFMETADRVLTERRRLTDERRQRLVDASDERARRGRPNDGAQEGEEIDRRVGDLIRQLIPILGSRFVSGTVISAKFLAWLSGIVLELLDKQQPQAGSDFKGQLPRLLFDFCGRNIDNCLEDLLLSLSDAVYSELAFRQLLGRIGEA